MPRPFRLRRRPRPNYHVVGDSTAATVHQRNSPDGLYGPGPGSTASGRGYTSGAPSGTITLTPPGADFVIAQLSLWDYESGDLTGYSDAHAYYAAYGVTIHWVELPPSPAVGDAPEVAEPGLGTFNSAVAAELGVTLLPQALRIVDTSDGIHPTVQGAKDLVDRYTNLTGTLVSRLRGVNPATLRGQFTEAASAAQGRTLAAGVAATAKDSQPPAVGVALAGGTVGPTGKESLPTGRGHAHVVGLVSATSKAAEARAATPALVSGLAVTGTTKAAVASSPAAVAGVAVTGTSRPTTGYGLVIAAGLGVGVQPGLALLRARLEQQTPTMGANRL